MRLVGVTAALAAAAMMLVGCAVKPGIPYDRTVAQVKTIGVLTPKFPDGPVVPLASNVGQSFGLIGALIDAGMQAERESKLTTMLKQQQFSVQERFLATLTAELEAKGYTVAVLPVPREAAGFVEQYPASPPTKVDAYLDIVTTAYGYVAAGIGASSPYRPLFSMNAKLVSANGASVLMQETIVYNLVRPRAGMFGDPYEHVVTVAPDPSHQFRNFDALMADPPTATLGMQAAADRSAQTIGKLLQ